MFDWFYTATFIIYTTANVVLLVYGLNSYMMIFLCKSRCQKVMQRHKKQEEAFEARVREEGEGICPIITTQIPLYNEYNVAERVTRAVAAMKYPEGKHQVQVLDDSTDETSELLDKVAADLREQGVWIEVLRREVRSGFKAGALNEGMKTAKGDYLAVFDSDFVPPEDFLLRMLPQFEGERIGLVQARWGHLNSKESLLTQAQSVGIDGHFVIEQPARSSNRLFLNFNGTAGIWRREAIEEAGGWRADTLTEDLDLSYRAQLAGWHLEYVPGVEVPAELPETFSAFKNQQFRWAKGSIQTAIKILPEVMGSKRNWFTKYQSIIHLLHYAAHPMMLILSLFALPFFFYAGDHFAGALRNSILIFPIALATMGPSTLYVVSQQTLHPERWLRRVALLPMLLVIGFGICISNSKAVFEALVGLKSEFVRTPKKGGRESKRYRARAGWVPFAEVLASLYCLLTLLVYCVNGLYGVIPFLLLYVVGFAVVGWSTLREQSRGF